jgi:Zn-dependent protease
MLDLLFTNPTFFFVFFGGIIVAIGLHEAAHCYMADYLGDPTPRSLGRLTLNPIAHLDPLGTLVLLVTGLFGWGKSSPYDPYNLKNPRRDTALIALAGPISNLVLAALLSILLRLASLPPAVGAILFALISLNVNLALFNMLPVPPLDGSKVLNLILSPNQSYSLQRFTSQNSYLLILLFILPIFGGNSIASLIISPISHFILGLLLP